MLDEKDCNGRMKKRLPILFGNAGTYDITTVIDPNSRPGQVGAQPVVCCAIAISGALIHSPR